MSPSVVILKDHLQGATTTLVIDEERKRPVQARWSLEDPLLTRLQGQPVFSGRTKLSELDPYHYRVLLALHLTALADLPAESREDPRNPTVRSYQWLLTGLILALEDRTQGSVSVLTVNRVSETAVMYDVSLSLEEFVFPHPKANGLRIVVDNVQG